MWGTNKSKDDTSRIVTKDFCLSQSKLSVRSTLPKDKVYADDVTTSAAALFSPTMIRWSLHWHLLKCSCRSDVIHDIMLHRECLFLYATIEEVWNCLPQKATWSFSEWSVMLLGHRKFTLQIEVSNLMFCTWKSSRIQALIPERAEKDPYMFIQLREVYCSCDGFFQGNKSSLCCQSHIAFRNTVRYYIFLVLYFSCKCTMV